MSNGFLKLFLIAILAMGLSACSLFSSLTEKTAKAEPKALEDLTQPTITLTEVWSKNIGKGVGKNFSLLEPAIDGDTVFVSDAQGTVLAINAETGREIWKRQLKVSVGGGVSADSGKVVLGTLNGELIVLNQADGEVLWRARLPSEVLSLPVIYEQFVAVQTLDDQLSVFDADKGNLLWNQSAIQPSLTLRGRASPTIADQEAVIAGYASGDVKAFSMANGAPIWVAKVSLPEGSNELERMVDVIAPPLIVGGTVFSGSYQGNTVAVDLYSGNVRWSKDVATYKPLSAGFGSLYITDPNGYVTALDQRSGGRQWRQQGLEHRSVTGPSTFSSYVVVGDYQGYIHLLSQVDGSFVGRFKVSSSEIKARPLVTGDRLFVLDSGGKLVMLKRS